MGLEKIRKKVLMTLLAIIIILLLIIIPKLDLSKTDMQSNIKKITGAVTEIDSPGAQNIIEKTKLTFNQNPAYIIIGIIFIAWLFGMFKR
jgi:hypothetical protein